MNQAKWNKRRSDRRGRNTRLLQTPCLFACLALSSPTIFKRRDLRSVTPAWAPGAGLLLPSSAPHYWITWVVLQGHCGEVRAMQTGLDATVYSAGLTTANLGEDRCSSTPVPPLPSFSRAETKAPGPVKRYCRVKLHSRVIWPPAALGSLFIGLDLDDLPLPAWCWAARTAASPDNKRKPYGAPSVLRRGKAGAPLLKGQTPHIALRLWSDTDGSNDKPGVKPSIRRSLHIASLQRWCLSNRTAHQLDYKFLGITLITQPYKIVHNVMHQVG